MAKSPGKKSASTRPRRKRRWLRIFVVLFLLLVVLGFAINGPIARWFIAKTVRDQLTTQGLTGDLKVEGQLVSGFTLRDGQFTGNGRIKLLKFGELGIRYRLLELLDKKVEAVHGSDLVIVAQPEPAKEPGEQASSEPAEYRQYGDVLREYRPLFLPVALELTNLDFRLERPEQAPLELTLGSLRHSPGSATISINQIESNLLGDDGLRRQDIVVTWGDDQIEIGEARLIPELVIRETALLFPPDKPLSIRSKAEVFETTLALSADEDGSVHIQQQGEPLDLSRLTHFPELELAGTVDTLEANFENLLENPSKWEGSATLQGSELRWSGGALDKIKLLCDIDSEINLDARVGEVLQVHATAPRPEGDSIEIDEWLAGLVVSLDLSAPSLHAGLREILPAAGQPVPDLEQIPEGALAFDGSLTLASTQSLSEAALHWSFSEITLGATPLPALTGTAGFKDEKATVALSLATPRPNESLTVEASFDLPSKEYSASLEASLPDPAWLLPLLPGEEELWKPTGPIAMGWNGQGSLTTEPSHSGDLNIDQLTLHAPEESLTEVALEGGYQWPGMVEIKALSLKNGDLRLGGTTKWEDETITLSELRLEDASGPVAILEGSAPLSLETLTIDSYLALEEPIGLTLSGNNLKLERITRLVPLSVPAGYAATLDYDLTIGGVPGQPTLDGSFSARNFRGPTPPELPPLPELNGTVTFRTEEQRLNVSGIVTEPDGELVKLDAIIPLELKTWVKDPNRFQELELSAHAHVEGFALQRLRLFNEQFAKAIGELNAGLHVEGTVGQPELTGSAVLSLEEYPLPDTPFQKLHDAEVVITLDENLVTIDERSVINCAGGSLNLVGSVNLGTDQPELALRLRADHLPAWRDDSIILRANGDISITGPLESARLAGQLSFVDSIFYKDVELIPFGLPAESVPKVELPRIDLDETANGGAPTLPPPFGNWALDLSIQTEDPLLVRGNLANGSITSDIKVGGTMDAPKPSGQVTIVDLEAVLPFSRLKIEAGELVMRPDAPYDPQLDIKGTSEVDDYLVSIRIFGPLSAPQYELFASPPLPESEILTLLATGTTSEGLQDPGAAAMKAAQLFISEFRKRASRPGGNARFLHILDGLDAVDLDFGESDRFTGRKFTSASMRISKSDRWYLSAGVDRDGQTRGLLTFKFRLRDLHPRNFRKELPDLLPQGLTREARAVTTTRIRGLTLMSEEAAIELLSSRLEFIRTRPPSQSHADDAAFLLERLLVQRGYARPEVTWEIPDKRTIILSVREGPRYEMRHVNAPGLTAEELREIGALFRATHLGETPQRNFLAKSGDVLVPYRPSRNPSAIGKTEALLESQGYWDATVELLKENKNPAGGPVDLDLQINRGPLYKLAPVLIESDDQLGLQVREAVSKVNGREATTRNIKIARATVERFYRKRGFSNARVQMFAEQKSGILQLRFRITQGTQYRVASVRVEGTERTKPERITNRFEEFLGATYEPDAFRGKLRDLFGTGAFEGMQLIEEDHPDGTVDFLLRVREAEEPDGYFTYLGADSYEGPFIGGGYYHRNLFGNLWNLSTGFEFSGLGLLGDVRVTDPWFLGYDLRFTPRAFLLTRKFEGYSKFEGGLGAEWAWAPDDHWSLAVDALWSYVTVGNAFVPSLPSEDLGTSDYLLQTVGMRSIWDYRNEKAVPTDGHFIQLMGEAGYVVGKEAVSFIRAEGEVSFYEPITKKSNVAIGARAGVVLPSKSDNDFPVDLRYFAGGSDSVRSFPTRELGPEASNGIPRGGESYWVANVEYIHQLVGPVNGVVFLDAGALSRDHGTLLTEDVKFAAGLGLRLNLPVGPVRLEYGHGFINDVDDPDGAFHFAIGTSF